MTALLLAWAAWVIMALMLAKGSGLAAAARQGSTPGEQWESLQLWELESMASQPAQLQLHGWRCAVLSAWLRLLRSRQCPISADQGPGEPASVSTQPLTQQALAGANVDGGIVGLHITHGEASSIVTLQ